MKKILLFTAIVLGWTAMQAQGLVREPYEPVEEKLEMTDFFSKAKDTTVWFNYPREISNIVTSMPYFRNFLFPDSTVQVEFSNGYGYVWLHSLAQVLDPTSGFFLSTGGISKDAKYTLDSIAIPYRYRRVQTANPDTLVIQIVTHSDLSFVESPNWTTPKSYARVRYDHTVRKGQDPAKEIVVLLDENDTATGSQNIIQEYINLNFQADEKVALTYTYFPGNPFNVGDTIDWYISPLPKNQINSFIAYTFRDETPTIDNGYYNHGGLVTSAVRYNDTVNTNGWEGQYIPGVAYFSGTYHSDVFFQLTYEDFTGINNPDLFEKFDIYPNPAVDVLNIEFKSNSADQSILEIRDVVGHLVRSERLNDYADVKRLDVSGYERGIYFATLKINGEIAQTRKLIIGN